MAGQAVARFPGSPVTSIMVTGGGARSEAWCQILADVLGIEVRRDALPVSVNARGAGWIGTVGFGTVTFADIPRLMRHHRVFAPTVAARTTCDELFLVYRRRHKRLARSTGASTGDPGGDQRRERQAGTGRPAFVARDPVDAPGGEPR